ncbi:MAG: ATP-binding protein [Candidatus Parvarchaeota archaeon]|nr:ATP-binding protein [Candidatus Jingweiarchaeum tengchongense]MCW1298188.1 ATP-binding protein [Candidatus Jingweiarchaeum tengchongense]MCW1299986.1 ATP-binding protein [Candidatus Jingweiarchaeum tengchongense]MCW1305024.1 ATP-binding protein [Candidatus Jingweiarchaeum tengchongense]MCW1305465.1 ATP-binding protein [Candidatus Jingweiarchaeum tengchongense]
MELIGRNFEMEKIERYIRHEHHCLIYGIKGIGKTRLLKEIRKKYFHRTLLIQTPITPRELLSDISNFLRIEHKRSRREQMEKILSELRKRREKLIFLIDDFDEITTETRKILNKILSIVILIATSEKDVRLNFREKIELVPLKWHESKQMAMRLLGNETRAQVINLIATKSEGIPGVIFQLCKDYKIASELGELKSRRDLHMLMNEQKPCVWKRINIIPLPALVFLSYLFLVGRYLLYGIGRFEDAFLIAIFGYATMAVARLLWIERNIDE